MEGIIPTQGEAWWTYWSRWLQPHSLAPLCSTPWEARLEEVLRSAQRDHLIPAEGKGPSWASTQEGPAWSLWYLRALCLEATGNFPGRA